MAKSAESGYRIPWRAPLATRSTAVVARLMRGSSDNGEEDCEEDNANPYHEQGHAGR